MKKLLINATSVKAGGAKKRLLEFVRRMDDDNRYRVILLKNNSFKIRLKNIRIITLPTRLESLFKLIADVLIIPVLFFFGYRSMYLYGNFFVSLYPGKILWNLTNIEPFVYQEFKIKYIGRQKWRLIILRALFAVSKVPDILVAQSASTARLVRSKKKCRIEYVYNGVNLNKKVIRTERGDVASNRDFEIIVISQLVRYKRIDQLILYLAEKRVLNISRLTIVGKLTWDKDYVDELFRLVDSLGVRERIKFCGELPHDKVLSLLVKSDALIYTNAYDNCPNAVLEAMSYGVHVVALENTVMKELAEKFGGISFFNFDVDYDKFVQMLNINIKSTYNFTWDDHYSEIMSLLEQL